MLRTIQTGGWLAGAACLLLTASSSAQLEPASWTELVRLYDGPLFYQEWAGQDATSPESLTHSVTSTQYSLESGLTFGPPGPPFITAHSEGTLSTYAYGIYGNRATAQGTVSFQLRIIEKAPPPVVVEYVPLMIGVHGSVVVAPNSYGSAVASLVVMNGNTQVFGKSSEANTRGDRGPILLDATQTVSIQPGVVLTGSTSFSALVALFTVDANIEATASVGPVFEIASAFIPGTASEYRDFFEIEYSPGYWALENPTPVHTTTWGKIKSLYSNR
jgi:hypothetical protein